MNPGTPLPLCHARGVRGPLGTVRNRRGRRFAGAEPKSVLAESERDVPRIAIRQGGRRTRVNLAHNERVKLLATALNNLGLAFIVSGVVVPVISGRAVGGGVLTLAWFGLGAALHLCGQFVLGRLRE